MIPSLLALYDVLNDDDDEIRDVGAEAVSFILKKNLIPLAAQTEFLSWLSLHFSEADNASVLLEYVIRRLTDTPCDGGNALKNTRAQLELSLQQNTALFVEEEQNLFIDEVREVKQVCQMSYILVTNQKSLAKSLTMSEFVVWTLAALRALNELTRPDKPLGWTSKPATFAICARILTCAGAVLDLKRAGVEAEEIMESIGAVREELEKVSLIHDFHPLLLEMVARGLGYEKTTKWIDEVSRGRLRPKKVKK